MLHRLFSLFVIFILFAVIFLNSPDVIASEASKDSNLSEVVKKNSVNSFTEEFKTNPPKRVRQFIYETPTIETLAYVHWGLSIFDLNDRESSDKNIDTFLKITECEIYNKYRADEFEWEKIRDATRENIKKNKIDFPIRFELAIPLTLAAYDPDKSIFELDSKNVIQSARLFELVAIDYANPVCGDEKVLFNIGNFYNAFLIELSRPFSLTNVPVEKTKAEKIIKIGNEEFQKVLEKAKFTSYQEEEIFKYRQAYLFLYIKIFTYRGKSDRRSQGDGLRFGQVLSVLDGYEIFQEPNKKNLLYSRSYMTKTDVVKQNEAMLKELEIIKVMLKGKGILAGRPEDTNL